MTKVRYWTWEDYENCKVSFRTAQRSKPRYDYRREEDEDWELVEYTTPRRMTNTWAKLQEEFNTWNKSRYRHDTIYFIVE